MGKSSVNKYEEFRKIPASLTLKCVNQLKDELPIDESGYLRVAGHSHADCRAYYLYGVLDELIKTSTTMLRWEKFLEDSHQHQPNQEDEFDKRLERCILEAVIDEQKMWQRKLTELLCNLICFTKNNENQYYRAVLAAAQLDAFVRLQSDFKEFFRL